MFLPKDIAQADFFIGLLILTLRDVMWQTQQLHINSWERRTVNKDGRYFRNEGVRDMVTHTQNCME